MLVAALLVVLMGVLSAVTATIRPSRSLVAQREFRGGDAAGYRYYRLGNPVDVRTLTRPGLVLQGGGTDIDESFHWMIDRSGGGDFLVLRTSGTAEYNDYIYDMTDPRGQAAASVATLIVTSRAASADAFVLRAIHDAEAIWIAGGDQASHLSFWRGTPVADALQARVAQGTPIGGTSSGLAVLGDYIYSAEIDRRSEPHLSSTVALRDPHHPRVTLTSGFLRVPHLDRVLLEPHFIQEGRHGRMAAFLARFAADDRGHEVRGIGIDRKTALLVEPGGAARVITGPDHPFGTATFFRLSNRAEVCEPGRPLTARAIEALVFGSGAEPDLSRWGGARGIAYQLSVVDGVPRKAQ